MLIISKLSFIKSYLYSYAKIFKFSQKGIGASSNTKKTSWFSSRNHWATFEPMHSSTRKMISRIQSAISSFEFGSDTLKTVSKCGWFNLFSGHVSRFFTSESPIRQVVFNLDLVIQNEFFRKRVGNLPHALSQVLNLDSSVIFVFGWDVMHKSRPYTKLFWIISKIGRTAELT